MTLAARLSGGEVLGLAARVVHARRGRLSHGFRTQTDFVLLDPTKAKPPPLMSLNRFNFLSFYRRDHGGTRGAGRGEGWAWQQLAALGLAPRPGLVLALLTQPRFLGYWFNPVSFWLLLEGDDLLAVIAEVNNTFGQRHSYLLARPDLQPITKDHRLQADKVFHVSPFQDVSGVYHFGFSLNSARIAIRILNLDGREGIYTAMAGPLARLTATAILRAALRRPGGALRVITQIYWQALRLKLKGAAYRKLPALPPKDISR